MERITGNREDCAPNVAWGRGRGFAQGVDLLDERGSADVSEKASLEVGRQVAISRCHGPDPARAMSPQFCPHLLLYRLLRSRMSQTKEHPGHSGLSVTGP
ncbi:hypothetical protein GCM10009544_02830 [Streptomyces stramineus]|uniref:Uncharacterized protein n=1 Tax=Streptomyces stramineus TaxID=173861 RepID=A0ABN0ZD28_9ACTN